MRDIPLKVYASWPAPNYVNPVTRGNELLITNIILITLVTFSIVIRIISRLKQARPGIDDVFIFIAYIFTIGLTIVVIMGALVLEKWKVLALALVVGGFLSVAVLDPVGTVGPILSAFRETLTSG